MYSHEDTNTKGCKHICNLFILYSEPSEDGHSPVHLCAEFHVGEFHCYLWTQW